MTLSPWLPWFFHYGVGGLVAAGTVLLVDACLDEVFVPDERAKKLVKRRIAEQQRERLASRKTKQPGARRTSKKHRTKSKAKKP